MSSLYSHMKKVHKKEEKLLSSTDVKSQEIPRAESENVFMISLYPECDLIAPVEVEQSFDTEEEHAARTHCTWPLERTHTYTHATATHAMDPHGIDDDAIDADAHAIDAHVVTEHEEMTQDAHLEIANDAYVLGEDVHVEQCEGAESNIFTIRSDLFLHGNVIHNEDSEHMSRAPPLDADLLDAPSVDFAQEELYSDAVDESSFRVFLLNAEELAVAE